jgi:hypothetical protein
MYHHDPPVAIADMMYSVFKDPMFQKSFTIHVYPNGAPGHHKPGAVFVQYSPEGAGIWTTMLGLAKAMIIADEKARKDQ